jgi:hypothetical protein
MRDDECMSAQETGEHEDPVLDALEELVSAARANIAEWSGVLERAAVVRDLRLQGRRYADMEIDTPGPSIMDTVSRNQERLTAAGARWRRTLAAALAAEGMSHSDIARAFRVSRQRVASLLSTADNIGRSRSDQPE